LVTHWDSEQSFCQNATSPSTIRTDSQTIRKSFKTRIVADGISGIGQTVYKVVSLPEFTLYPHQGSEMVWRLSKQRHAANGAIMRTSILGTYEFWDVEKVAENTEKIAKVTHWDPRCVGSCVVITTLIASLLSESNWMTVEQLGQIADRYDGRIKSYIENAWSSSVEELQLDEPDSMGYTLKAMSAGVWAYVHAENFEHGLLEVINEGGDADTNGAVAGSILGAKFGYHSIPQKYIDGLIRRDVLEAKFNDYIYRLQKRYAK
jgi:ADP-ribosylglycohydrolase